MQQRPHRQAHRTGQVDAGDDRVEDDLDLADVAVDHGHTLVALGGERAQVGEDHRVDVDVGDVRARVDRLRPLMRVGHRRQAAAEVNELADPVLGRPGGGPGEKLPVLPHDIGRDRRDGQQLQRDVAVDGKIVLAVQQIVVNPGNRRRTRIKFGHGTNRSVPMNSTGPGGVW